MKQLIKLLRNQSQQLTVWLRGRTGANFGFGAKYDFTPNFAVRAEWERLNKVGEDATTGETDMDFLSAGLTIKF